MSDRDPNPYHLRVLAKEENDRQMKSEAVTTLAPNEKPDLLPITFQCSSFSCGVWSYANSDLVFVPQQTWNVGGTAKFGQRAMVLALDSNQRVDFRYPGIDGITTEDGALILSMLELPHF